MTDTPRTPRVVPTREQIAEALYLADHEDDLWLSASTLQRAAYRKNADAVLALIDKENTRPDDTVQGFAKLPENSDATILVPRALIERAKEALIEVPPSSRNADIYGDLHALLDPPKPSAPRLRVVRLGSEHSTYETIRHETAHVFVDLEAQPDVLTVIDAAVAAVLDSTDTESVMDSIRAALGVE